MTDVGSDARVADLIAARRAAARRGIERVDSGEPAPLSSIQLALFTMVALEGAAGQGNRPVALRLTGPLDADALATALSALVARHEPLHTIYPFTGEEPIQEVLAPFAVDLRLVDVSAADPSRGNEVLDELFRAATTARRDPTSEVQFDATLVRQAADRHVLVIGMHHIGFDGWSESVFVADLTELYRAAVDGTDPVLPELPIKFSDYARWERAEGNTGDHEREADYWREELAGLGHAPPLRPGRARDERYAPVTAALDAEVMAAVHALARAEKTTPFVVLLAALELLARELLDADDFVISCPIAGRDRPEVQDLVGCFINHVFVRSSLRDARTHLDHLREVRSRVAGALAHRSVPNQEITGEFGGWSRRPRLFRMSFQWRDFPRRGASGPVDVDIEPMSVPYGVSGLALYVTPKGEAAELEIRYNPKLFAADDIEVWADRLRRHVVALCADPMAPLPPARPLQTLPDPTRALEADRVEPITVNISRRARTAPETIAVESSIGSLDYGTLWERSGVLAAGLVDAGVCPGSPVIIAAHPSPGHIVAMVAVFRAGGVAVPIDATLPGKRQDQMRATSGAAHTITVGAAEHRPIEQGPAEAAPEMTVLAVDALGAFIGAAPAPLRRVSLDARDDAAYIFFTSGTTGTPKAILGTHHGLAHFLIWERGRLGVRVGDRVGASAGVSFDVSLREIFLPLTAGATLVLPEPDLLPHRVLSTWAETSVSILHVTPSTAWAWLTEAPPDARLPELRWVAFAGEPLAAELVARWREIAPQCRVLNLYGPTETCLAKAGHEIGQNPIPGAQPVGHALPHTQLLVVDQATGELCEPGDWGEVVIRTDIGTAGYLDPDIGGFEPNPFGADPGDLVYRTGDLGSIDPDGLVTLAGRIDDQVKIDGVRVEPAEAAAALRRHPAVAHCAVVAHKGPEPRLEAFVVPEGDEPTARELRDHLREWLPAAAIPAVFTMVPDIPLTPNGKVDREALGAGSPPEPASVTVTPAADVVIRVWSAVLGKDLPADADFFEHGGTSLRALRILARLEAETGFAGPVDLFFDHPTLDEFGAAFSELAAGSAPAAGTSPVGRHAESSALSYLQESMWFETWMSPDAQAYLLDRVFSIAGPFDTDAFRQAIATVVDRHEILRSRVVLEQGEPRLIIADPEPPPLTVESVTGDPDPDAAAQRRVEVERARMFDLAAESPIRFLLIEVGPDRHVLYVSQHHIVTDGWSQRILWQEIGIAYNAVVAGTDPELPELEAQFVDYVARQRELEHSGGFEAGIEYWRRALHEPLPHISHPGDDRSGERVPSVRYKFEVDTALTKRLGATAQKLRCTPFMVALSLWAAFLACKADEDEVLIGMPIADRGWAPSAPLLGVFLNTLVVRLRATRDDTLEAVATRARGTVLEAFSHAHVPYERVIETVSGERHRSRVPLFQALFQYHHEESLLRAPLELEGLQIERIGGDSTGPPIDFYLALNHSEEKTAGFLAHDPRLIDLDEAAALVDEYLEFIAAAIVDPAAPLPSVQPFTASEAGLADRPEAAADPLPLSFGQEAMWVAEQQQPGSPRYIVARAKHITGSLDPELLTRAVDAVVARHDVLRSRVPTAQGLPEVVVDPPGRQVVWRHDLRHLGEDRRAQGVAALVDDLVATPFDLADGPLLRVHLVHVAADEWLFIAMFHHLVVDGQSFPIFYRELSATYRALAVGATPDAEPLANQYADYAARQRRLAESGEYEAHLRHWREVLREPLPPIDLGSPQPGASPAEGLVAERALPREIVEHMATVANDLRITPYMLGLAIVAAATAEVTGHDEALVATVMADRSWRPGRGLIGPFVNTIPMRVRIESDATLAALAPQVRTTLLDAYSHGVVPSELILLQGSRPSARGALGAVEFDLTEDGGSAFDLADDHVVRRHAVRRAGLKFDLSINIRMVASRPVVRVEGRADRFAAADLDAIAETVAGALTGALADPQGHRLRSAVTAADPLVPQRAAASWSTQPDHPAIEVDDRTVRGSELAELVARFAAQLHHAGLGPGDRVALDAHRSPETIAAMYATWQLGATYVPIDLDAPADRNAVIIADCEAAIFVTGRRGVALDGAITTLVLDPGRPTRDPAPVVAADPDAIAYIIYTSGSSGRPKGVMIDHRALASYATAAVEAYSMEPGDRVLQFHSLAFDASVEEIHVPLALGATVVLRTDALLGSARRFMEFVAARDISVVSIPTALWHEMVPQMHTGAAALPPSMRVMVIGGEGARATTAALWHDLGDRPVLINSYGPTETTVVALTAEVRPPVDDGLVPIGRPVRSMEARVADPDGRTVPAGDWGELVLAGPQLAAGYVGRPEETEAAFTVLDDGRRWYRTGDHARVRDDGDIEVAGRFDDQTKIAGHRIELGEVEAALRSLAGVADAAVVVGGPADDPRLEAHVVGPAELTPGQVVADLAAVVPAAMVPARITVVEVLPRAVSGKVDREQLRVQSTPVSEQPPPVAPAAAVAAPSVGTDTVDRLIAVWAELLGTDEIDAASDFFELGGRSLTAVRLAYLIEEAFGVSVAVATIFEEPTVGQVAAAIDSELGLPAVPVAPVAVPEPIAEPVPVAVPEPIAEPAPVVKPEMVEGVTVAARPAAPPTPTESALDKWPRSPVRLHLDRAPLSLAQQRLWLHGLMRPEALPYLLPFEYRLRGPVDLDVLDATFSALVTRHEILRTRIVVDEEGRAAQAVDGAPRAGAILARADVSHVDPRQRRNEAAALGATFCARPIDLATEHPFRAHITRLSDTEHHLSLVFHHVAVDERGVQLLLDELAALYAHRAGVAEEPPPPALQFADFAVWQRARLRDGSHDASLAYWRELLGSTPRVIDVPGRRSEVTPGAGIERHDVDLSAATSDALLRLARETGVSPFQVVVALTTALFHRLTGDEQVIIGSPGSERSTPALDGISGLFVNTVIIATEVGPGTTFRELLRLIRARTGAALEHGSVPFEAVLEQVQIERDVERMPLVSVMCQFTDRAEREDLALVGLELERIRRDRGAAGTVADLMVAGELSTEGRLAVTLKHDVGILDPSVIGELGRSLNHLARTVADHPDGLVGDLALVAAEEASWLAEGFNGNDRPFPTDERIEEAFVAAASKTPTAVAVSDGRRDLTYGALEFEADELAEVLRAEGVAPGDLVGVELDRSIELVVALIAVLRAGAVYVPLDGAMPPARRAAVLELAGVAAVITAADGRLEVEVEARPRPQLPEGDGSPPAYVMFTSGSTGVPKGVVVSHRAIQRTVRGVDYAPLAPATVLAMASNPAFDALTFEVWGALANGGRIEIIDTETLADPSALAATLRSRRINTMFLTTSLCTLVAAAVPDAFAEMHTLMVGGESADVATMRQLLETGPRRLVNIYGPTECTTFSAWHHIREVPDGARSVPIGGPTANTSLHVLAADGALVPRGVTGELCIAGPGLAHGYLGDPELTAARFVEVEIAGTSTRVYRTGDLVRRRADGAIDYVGRLDHQVKLRGFRIELSEVEAAIAADPSVIAAAVKVLGEGAARRLVAFITPARHAVDPDAVRSTLATVLPDYMVPARVVVLDALPLTPSGKVDRKALVEPAADDTPPDPAGELLSADERDMLALWAEALDAPVGPDDDFFAAGGNSLLAVELLTRVERRFEVRLPLSSLFEERTPRAMVGAIGRRAESAGTSSRYLVVLRDGDPDHRVPLWLVHPAGGSLILYEPMVSHFKSDHLVVGVEAKGLDGAEEPLTDVHEIADHQVATIRGFQPHGPYRIVGYSVGGIVALEVARRLVDAGEVVELLGAIEAGVPSPPGVPVSRRTKYARLLRERGLHGVATAAAEAVRERVTDTRTYLSERGTLAEIHRRVLDANTDAFLAYDPRPVDIPITLFFGDQTSEEVTARLRRRWGALASGIRVLQVSGAHGDDAVLRDPHAKILAIAMEDVLDECDRGTSA